MPVPTSIDDLSTTAGSNSPSGADSPGDGDNYIRALSAFTAQLRDKLDGTSDTGIIKNATFSGTMVGAASWAALQTFAAGVNVGNAAQSNVNTLDWYEEGTFTPALAFGGGSTGITYSSRTGAFTRIGNVVHFTFFIGLTAKGSSTGVATVGTLPYTSGSAIAVAAMNARNITISSSVVATIAANATSVGFIDAIGGGVVSVDDTDFSDTTQITVTGFYFV